MVEVQFGPASAFPTRCDPLRTCPQLAAAHFDGLPRLAALQELDASGTGFDDDCCARLAALPHLSDLE